MDGFIDFGLRQVYIIHKMAPRYMRSRYRIWYLYINLA